MRSAPYFQHFGWGHASDPSTEQPLPAPHRAPPPYGNLPQRRWDAGNTTPDNVSPAPPRPCGKNSPTPPRATPPRGPPAETLGRMEYPPQTTSPLRLCAPAGKIPLPPPRPTSQRGPPAETLGRRENHPRQRLPCASAPLREKFPTPTAPHLPAGSSRRDAGTQGIPTPDNASPAPLRPCGKNSLPPPRPTSRRDPPAETLGRREYPPQTTPPLRLCAPAGKPSPPHATSRRALGGASYPT